MSTLELRAVSVRYGKREVVAPFSATIDEGSWLALIGPNGAGKTSLLRAVAGLLEHGGDVLVDGRRLVDLHRRERAALITYLPQTPLLPDEMTAFDYVLLGRSPFIRYFAFETPADRASVRSVLDELDLGDLAVRPLGQLSGGERQRMVIARALATEASIMLLDEPTTALDIGHQQQTLDLVARLRAERGLTVITAMHDLTLTGLYADELVLLHRGAEVARGTATEVLTEEHLKDYYGARVQVLHQPDGTAVVVPAAGPVVR
jgi:iron complex transport system ATP-binding protein